ncbi:polyhydroxyalkanoate synthesis regulator DNA-binding domain-containing protein [Legionella busanensis]|uniref:polyhydroxyalkanoate synthesis regulator DNA-binding domain-containing protein n=1 Tax=Legionella busanensis TaxID=190655 RepID=UPI000E1BCAEA|nr:polyhydroxyalkanoate synthesis regulator DNA-binding domain-containing protein [Legionella busanensis]
MVRLIKKYKNRRLYDTERSQYITVEELQGYVVQGIAFRVEDSSTNKDITSATLLQILVEMESTTSQFLSADMLKHLIVLASHPMSQAYKNILEQLFASFETSIKKSPYLQDYQQTAQLWQQQVGEMFNQWQSLFKAK